MMSSEVAAQASVFEARERDWRHGAVVYQVIVDRFAPAAQLQAKRALYPYPKVLRAWHETPHANSERAPGTEVTRHELDFWGGDLQSLRSRLDHVQQLGATVLYLNPIHLGFTNHKYDALDFQSVSPEYGTRQDVRDLAAELKRRDMKLVLDGVFNHMGRNAPAFKQAQTAYQAQPQAPMGWFVFGPQFPGGARTWKGVLNLPELNLEHPPVREHLWGSATSVVRSYLQDGADGWRLDTAYELGPKFLAELTTAAHHEKPGSLVVGEIVSYPGGWMPAMDAVMNFHWRTLILGLVRGEMSVAKAAAVLDRTVADVGIEPLLKSWLLLDNHDLKRLATELPGEPQRRLAQVLQFTLPGSPNLYYGSEVGMTGGDDPEQRGPMRWDRVEQGHPDLAWTKQLVALHRGHRALRVGNYRAATAEKLLAFERFTDRAADTVLVLLNPSSHTVSEQVQWLNGAMMDGNVLRDLLPPPANSAPAVHSAGFVHITLPPFSARVLTPDVGEQGGYSVFKRL
jgi:glycosidase